MSDTLAPHVEVFNYSAWPQPEDGDFGMEFHLVYQGSLPAAGQGGKKTRTKEKHEIRKVFHKQLASLWKTHPFLIDFMDQDKKEWPDKSFASNNPYPRHNLINRYARCGYRFLPLVSDWFAVSCALDILFLRRDGPGSLIKSGGDIDNRVKVLFDGLRMPQTCDEVCGEAPGENEDPFYCLLEDDKLISQVKVETNWLLAPQGSNESIHDVHLVVKVKTIMSGAKQYETAFI